MVTLEALKQELAQHDPLQVIAGSAAIQLLPANAEHPESLLALSLESIQYEERPGRKPSPQHWRRWLHQAPSLHRGPAWDPYEGPITEPVPFFGGSFVVHTGGAPESVFELKCLLDALFL